MLPLLPLLEDLVVAEFGNRELNELRRHLASPEEEMSTALRAKQFLDSLVKVQKKKPQQVYGWAGTRLAERTIQARPAITRGHTSVGTILLQISLIASTIVPERLPDSACPEFWGDLMGGDVVRVGFDGDEELVWVLEGAVRALAAHFGEEVEITEGFANHSLRNRRLVDVRRFPRTRASSRTPGLATSGLSSAAFRG